MQIGTVYIMYIISIENMDLEVHGVRMYTGEQGYTVPLGTHTTDSGAGGGYRVYVVETTGYPLRIDTTVQAGTRGSGDRLLESRFRVRSPT